MSPPNEEVAAPASRSCLVCGGNHLGAAAGYLGLVACRDCGFLTADLELTFEDIRAVYGHDYFHGSEYLDYRKEETSLRRNFRRRLDTMVRWLPDSGRCRLFEVGCAYGFFLAEAHQRFGDVAGIDINHEAVFYAKNHLKINTAEGDYLDHALPEPVDAICLWDVIEHLNRPDQVLEKVVRDLKPGGIMCLTTGDVGSLNARLRKGKWRMVHPPTHLHYFSASTMCRLLSRVGLDVVSVSYPGISRSIGMILFGVVAVGMKRPRLYRRLARLPFTDWHVTLNLFDVMQVVARKPARS